MKTSPQQHPGPAGKLAAVVILTLLVAWTPDHALASPRSFEKIMEEAETARENGDMNRAIALIREAYDLEPQAELLNNLGRIYEQQGRYTEAYKTYKQVSNDPEADPDLRTLDAARAAELRPMLTRAWLLTKILPRDARILVDGAEPTPSVTGEIPLDRGDHVIEVSHPGSGQVRVHREAYPIGRRSVLTLDLTRPGVNDGRIRIANSAGLSSLVIDGYALRAPLEQVSVIRLPVGPHEISTTREGAGTVISEVHLARGDLRALAGIVATGTVKMPPPAIAPAPPPPAAPIPAPIPPPTPAEAAPPGLPDAPGAEVGPTPAPEPAPLPPEIPLTPESAGAVRVVCSVESARGRIGAGAMETLTHTWTDVPAGTHFVTVVASDYASWTRKVVVRTGQTVEVVAELSKAGRLKITADGDQPSEVFLEGALVGKTPVMLDVETGTHLILIKRGDGKSEEAHVTVGQEGLTTFHADFGKRRSRVRHRAMPYSAQPIDKGYGSLDLGLGWPFLGEVRINTGLNERLDIGLTWQTAAHILNEFLLRGKWLAVRSRAFAVAVQAEAGFGLGDGDRGSARAEVRGLASILIREKAAVTARAGLTLSRDWTEEVEPHSTLGLPLGLTVEIRLDKFWNLFFLLEGEPFTASRRVFDRLHLDALELERPDVRGAAGFSLLF